MILLLKVLSWLVLFSSPVVLGEIRIVSESATVVVDDGFSVDAEETGPSATSLRVGGGSVFTVDSGHWLALNDKVIVGDVVATLGDVVTVHSGPRDVSSPTLQWTLRVVQADALAAFGLSRAPRPVIGVTTSALDPALATQLGVAAADCLVVVGVSDGLPASRAGLAEYDVIVAVNGQAPVNQQLLREVIIAQGVGGSVELELLRQGDPLTLDIAVGESEENAYNDALATYQAALEDGARSDPFSQVDAVRGLLAERRAVGSATGSTGPELLEVLGYVARPGRPATSTKDLLARQRLADLLATERDLDDKALALRRLVGLAAAAQEQGAAEQPLVQLRFHADWLTQLAGRGVLDAEDQQRALVLSQAARGRLAVLELSGEEARLSAEKTASLVDESAREQAVMAEVLQRRAAEIATKLSDAKDRAGELAYRLEVEAAVQLAAAKQQLELADRWQAVSIVDDPEGLGRSLVLGTGSVESKLSARLGLIDDRLERIEKLLREFVERTR